MSAWPARLSPEAAKTLAGLPGHAAEILRDVLDIASRDPWSFPAFNVRDPEGEDVRSAAVGQLTAIYSARQPPLRDQHRLDRLTHPDRVPH
ncbi:hypothetical protein [Streptomyces virginiae]|uniref:hypothetical protein n=1 Tax=Streptomyces virginiae TaxID=1961 RepID=UPI0030E0035F